MEKSPERILARKLNSALVLISLLPDAILSVGLAMGWYIRWQAFETQKSIQYVGFGGIALIALNLLLSRLIRQLTVFVSVYHSFIGCLLGFVSLYEISAALQHSYSELEEIVSLLLTCSALCQVLVEVVLKCCRTTSLLHRGRIWTSCDLWQLFGLSTAILLSSHQNKETLALLALLFAFFVVVTAIKLGSWLSMLSLLFLLVTAEYYVFADLHLSTNPYGVACIVCRFAAPPVVDLLLGASQSRLEKWQRFITAGQCVQRSLLLCVIVLEGLFFAAHAHAVKSHKEWYVIIPMFGCVSAFWAVMHSVFLIICTNLIRRFSNTWTLHGGGRGELSTGKNGCDFASMKKILTARGLRYFSLIANRLVYVCIGTTIAIGLLCWTTRTAFNYSLLALVLAVEAMVAELLNEFTTNLGGTCTGYAIVAPTVSVRNDGYVTVLPPTFIQNAGARSTDTLKSVVEFFAQHMITNHGCEWSMGGVTEEDLEKRLIDFTTSTTSEGPRFDTYFLYYSGPTTDTGEWALSGGATMNLLRLLELWTEHNPSGTSRLIVFCDCERAHSWLKSVWRIAEQRCYVALQTFRPSSTVAGSHKYRDPEEQTVSCVGEFTENWVLYNSVFNAAAADRSNLFDQQSTFKPAYAVSRRWTDFQFHLPDSREILMYWLQLMPSCSHPCLSLVVPLLSSRLSLTCCGGCTKALRRYRMRLWPPAELDTKHGFSLIRT